MLSTYITALFKNKAQFPLRQIKVCMPNMFRIQLLTLGEPTIVIINLRTNIKAQVYINVLMYTMPSTRKQEATEKLFMQLLGSFLMELRVWRAGERKKDLKPDRLTAKGLPGLWRKNTALAQKGLSTSFPAGSQLLSPLHPGTSIGDIHLQLLSQSAIKDAAGVPQTPAAESCPL